MRLTPNQQAQQWAQDTDPAELLDFAAGHTPLRMALTAWPSDLDAGMSVPGEERARRAHDTIAARFLNVPGSGPWLASTLIDDLAALPETPDSTSGLSMLAMLHQAWQKAPTYNHLHGVHIETPGNANGHSLVRSPGMLSHLMLNALEVETVAVDGLPLGTATVPVTIYRRRQQPQPDEQPPLLVGPQTLQGEVIGDIIIRSMSAHPMTGDERNTLRGDVHRLALFIYAATSGAIVPEEEGAFFLSGKTSEAAKQRWWAAVRTTRYLDFTINPRTGEFRDLAIASIDDGMAYLAPPAWWQGKNAWRLTGGLFRPALADEADKTLADVTHGSLK